MLAVEVVEPSKTKRTVETTEKNRGGLREKDLSRAASFFFFGGQSESERERNVVSETTLERSYGEKEIKRAKVRSLRYLSSVRVDNGNEAAGRASECLGAMGKSPSATAAARSSTYCPRHTPAPRHCCEGEQQDSEEKTAKKARRAGGERKGEGERERERDGGGRGRAAEQREGRLRKRREITNLEKKRKERSRRRDGKERLTVKTEKKKKEESMREIEMREWKQKEEKEAERRKKRPEEEANEGRQGETDGSSEQERNRTRHTRCRVD